jgi:flagellar basal-body rod protein FlgB
MDFSNITLFNIMKSKLNYMSERQNLLAQNIANADIPSYKAKDIAAPDFKKMASDAGSGPVRKLHLTTTNAKHISQNGGGAPADFKVVTSKKTSELNPDGNNVVIEEEMAKMAQNQADYQKVLNLYGKAITMFKTAIGNPNTNG